MPQRHSSAEPVVRVPEIYRAVVTRWNKVKASIQHEGVGDIKFGPEEMTERHRCHFNEFLKGRTVEYELVQGADRRKVLKNVRVVIERETEVG